MFCFNFFMFIDSLNWQHILCEDPSPNPDIETLFVDHVCPKTEVSFVESVESNLNVRSMLEQGF